jgi:hypothetical protein
LSLKAERNAKMGHSFERRRSSPENCAGAVTAGRRMNGFLTRPRVRPSCCSLGAAVRRAHLIS